MRFQAPFRSGNSIPAPVSVPGLTSPTLDVHRHCSLHDRYLGGDHWLRQRNHRSVVGPAEHCHPYRLRQRPPAWLSLDRLGQDPASHPRRGRCFAGRSERRSCRHLHRRQRFGHGQRSHTSGHRRRIRRHASSLRISRQPWPDAAGRRSHSPVSFRNHRAHLHSWRLHRIARHRPALDACNPRHHRTRRNLRLCRQRYGDHQPGLRTRIFHRHRCCSVERSPNPHRECQIFGRLELPSRS